MVPIMATLKAPNVSVVRDRVLGMDAGLLFQKWELYVSMNVL